MEEAHPFMLFFWDLAEPNRDKTQVLKTLRFLSMMTAGSNSIKKE
jgi:hypothetical protein